MLHLSFRQADQHVRPKYRVWADLETSASS